MRRKNVMIFACAVVVCNFFSLGVIAQASSDDLKTQRITIRTQDRPLYDVFAVLMYEYDITIGFEESLLDQGHDNYYFETIMPPEDKKKEFPGEPYARSVSLGAKADFISLNFTNAPLKDVLDDIVKQMRNYDWEMKDGVVNVFPIKGRNPKLEELLNLRVREFRVSKRQGFATIQPSIVLALPEFRDFLAQKNLYAESDRYMPSYADLPLPVDIRFTDVTFKDLLNRITKLKRGGWILRTGSKHSKPANKGKEVIEILI